MLTKDTGAMLEKGASSAKDHNRKYEDYVYGNR